MDLAESLDSLDGGVDAGAMTDIPLASMLSGKLKSEGIWMTGWDSFNGNVVVKVWDVVVSVGEFRATEAGTQWAWDTLLVLVANVAKEFVGEGLNLAVREVANGSNNNTIALVVVIGKIDNVLASDRSKNDQNVKYDNLKHQYFLITITYWMLSVVP